MNRRYDVLLCDADNTIFDFNRAEEIAFAKACSRMGIEASAQALSLYSQINDALWKQLEQGTIDQRTLRVRRFEQYLERVGCGNVSAQEMNEAYMDALGRQSIPLPGAVEAMKRWSRVLPVIIVTNGIAAVQRSRMQGSEVRELISGLVISEEVGASKPNPRMLEVGMQMAGVCDRRRALMLGDSLTSDIAAAANAGVDACWFNPNGAANVRGLPVAYEIRSLDEVDAILMQREGAQE